MEKGGDIKGWEPQHNQHSRQPKKRDNGKQNYKPGKHLAPSSGLRFTYL